MPALVVALPADYPHGAARARVEAHPPRLAGGAAGAGAGGGLTAAALEAAARELHAAAAQPPAPMGLSSLAWAWRHIGGRCARA